MASIFTEAHWKKLAKIVDDLMARPDCGPFHKPVAWKKLGLNDYPMFVKYPMDLGTIQTRLQIGYYDSIYDAARDIRLVWHNCLLYNGEASPFRPLGKKLRDIFEEQYTLLLKEISTSPENGISGVCLQDRRNLTLLLSEISEEELGMALVEIGSKHPAAVARNDDDELTLNMDVIPGQLVLELKARLEETQRVVRVDVPLAAMGEVAGRIG